MMDSNEPGRRRKRAAISCSLCRKRKIRCDRELPCSNCSKSRGGICVYTDSIAETAPADSNDGNQHGSSSNSRRSMTTIDASSNHRSISMLSMSTPASSHSTNSNLHAIDPKKRGNEDFEDQPYEASRPREAAVPVKTTSMEITSTRITEPFHVYHDSPSHGTSHPVVRGVMHKTRLFGKSNWVNGVNLFLDTIEAMDIPNRPETSNALANLQKCKSLGKAIKSRREPLWPTPPTLDFPSKNIADELVDRYLRTIETVHRILHIPSFMRDYETLWTAIREADSGFVVQLKLVLAIGAATFDEHFSLRASAIRWVFEAQTWISAPEFKSRLSIQALQTNILLSVARECTGIGASLVWVTNGSVLRAAVHMGLHRDPEHLQVKTTFVVEMRRRLWNTILELDLLSSLTSGGPPLISLADFDTQSPRNFDDDQLSTEEPVPKGEDDFTQVAVAIALRKTFPVRLGVIKFLNDLSSRGAYDDTLKLDAEVRAAYKSLRRTLLGFTTASKPSLALFELGFIDTLMYRFVSALHVPFFGPSMQDSRYAFSRKVAVESSLKIWCTVHPASMIKQVARAHTKISNDERLSRLAACGSGFLRTTIMQASFLIAIELRNQLQEDENLGPVPIRTDLLSMLEASKEFSLQCIHAGETNIKGYLLLSILATHVEGLSQGMGEDELPLLLIKEMETVGEICLEVLEKHAVKIQAEGNEGDLEGVTSSVQAELIENWDFMISDDIFNFGSYGLVLD